LLLHKASCLQKCILFVCLLEGYQEAAEHFQNEASVEPGEDVSTLQERMQVREAVQNGHIENAVQLIDSHFPGLLLSNNELRFQLQVCSWLIIAVKSVFWWTMFYLLPPSRLIVINHKVVDEGSWNF